MRFEFRRRLAVGTGVGVEIRDTALHVTVARVRPSHADVLADITIEGFSQRPAAEWGREYADFLKQHGASHLTATVLLPRREVVVRLLSLPGVSRSDLAAAIRFQADALHPWGEEEALLAWAPIGASGTVLAALARRSTIDHYAALFAEAGVRASSMTFSAAALYSAVRLITVPDASGFLGVAETESGLEAYGESAARPIFSATLDLPREKATALASSELRLPEGAEPVEMAALLPAPRKAPPGYDLPRSTLAYAAALAGACPRLGLAANLLPAAQRSSNSRIMFIPTLALALLLAVGLVLLASIRPVEDRRYLAALDSERARLEPQANRSLSLDRAIEAARARARVLDDFRRRSKADLDALQELTRLLEPPTWLSSFELSRDAVTVGGESERSGELLKIIDGSPLFQNSEFVVPLMRAGQKELFRIRASREGVR